MAERSMALVKGTSLSGVVGSNPTVADTSYFAHYFNILSRARGQ